MKFTEILMIVLFLVVVVIFLYFAFVMYIYFAFGIDISISNIVLKIKVFRQLKNNKKKYNDLLTKNLSYYKSLPEQKRKKFLKRVIEFLITKEFMPKEMLILTEENKLLISASAIMITFGLKDYLLSHFSKIIIYPGIYYSTYNKQYHKGEVNSKGVIVISLKDFNHGFAFPEDGVNVGIHEMTHAIYVDLLLNSDCYKEFADRFRHWLRVTEADFQKLKNGNGIFLRNYAGTNRSEFFAVCVENFFERPQKFKKELPNLYYNLVYLLNQDPEKIIQKSTNLL